MKLTEFSLRNPYGTIAAALIVSVLGLAAFFTMPTDLFPNTTPPQALVLTVWPGASAGDVDGNITRILEKELNSLAGRAKVRSTTRDEVSSISVEFEYGKSMAEMLAEVQNAIARVRADLPSDILEPRIYKITDANRPLLTLAVRPRPDSRQTLPQIRLLAENELSDTLLNLPGVSDVQIFGAHEPEIQILADRAVLERYDLTLADLVAALAQQNVASPAGTIIGNNREYQIVTDGQFDDLQSIRRLPVRHSEGGQILVSDVAAVRLHERPARSIYHGNGKPAIALNILRSDNGPTVTAIEAVKSALPQIEARYPDLLFDITDDQQRLIDINLQGMKSSLVQAVLITVVVIFLFLANLRAAAVVSVSIPLTFLAGLAILSMTPYTLNMVTLSGLIISVGMVVDASVVALENIYRHFREERRSAVEAARVGAGEITLEITAGMLTTVVVLLPVMFVGGYTQQVMRPLIIVIISTLLASLVCALTVVPLMAARMLAGGERKPNAIERLAGGVDHLMDKLSALYVALLRRALRHRVITLVITLVFVIGTMRVIMPMLGGELMPPMDTGIVLVDIETPSDYSPAAVEEVLNRVEALIAETKSVEAISSVLGSEPGQVSFGAGGSTVQGGRLTVRLVDRTQRKDTIWDVQNRWRKALHEMAGVRAFMLSEYGATPMSTTRAPLDVAISGPDPVMLSALADRVITALRGMPGIEDVRRSWYTDKNEIRILPDPQTTAYYGVNPATIGKELKNAIKGFPAGVMNLDQFLDIPITVRLAGEQLDHPDRLAETRIRTRFGLIPLSAMAAVTNALEAPFVTRENLLRTVNVTAINRGYTIKQVAAMAKERLAFDDIPAGYSVTVAGSAADMAKSQKSMGKALLLGLVLLYVLLVAMFRSFKHPVTVLAAIPPAVAGAVWGLFLFDKPMCQPAMMGLILLGGTIVNNSILMIGFINHAIEHGMKLNEALLQSVRLRIRPIFMTTVSTILGLTPLVFELAVGLERMSPLGIAAATGLLAGTFMTLIVVPVIYSLLSGASRA